MKKKILIKTTDGRMIRKLEGKKTGCCDTCGSAQAIYLRFYEYKCKRCGYHFEYVA